MKEPTRHFPEWTIALIGPCGVGKSSLSVRLSCETFSEQYRPTRATRATTLQVPHQQERFMIEVQVHDCSGNPLIQSMGFTTFKYTHLLVCVFDCSRLDSFYGMTQWYEAYIRTRTSTRNCTVYVVANKVDLLLPKPNVRDPSSPTTEPQYCPPQEITNWINQIGGQLYCTSAKQFTGITGLHRDIMKQVQLNYVLYRKQFELFYTQTIEKLNNEAIQALKQKEDDKLREQFWWKQLTTPGGEHEAECNNINKQNGHQLTKQVFKVDDKTTVDCDEQFMVY